MFIFIVPIINLMRALIQRVNQASVEITRETIASIGKGLMILLGIEETDEVEDVAWLCSKISRLRIFNDDKGIMNLSVMEINGEILLVSQFTLYASTKKGNRPSYIRAARPGIAIPLYNAFIRQLENETGRPIQTGTFGAMMNISLVNDGPVTLLIDSKNRE